jgi:hypothetical protein
MTNGPLSAPFDVIASAFSDEERLGAALVGVVVDAFFDGEVEDFAFGDGLAGWFGVSI